jgi:hypothetical protein
MEVMLVCRNIKPLFNFDPPATDGEIRDAALQYVRKISGSNKPSKVNEAAFLAAVDDIATASKNFLGSLQTTVLPRTREKESLKARKRAARRFNT